MIQSISNTDNSVIFWPSTLPKNAIPRCCTGRKWQIPMASNRKRSRGRIKADNMGQGKVPLCHYRVMHRKRVTSELHDCYFRLLMIKHSISKIEWVSKDYITQLSPTSQWISRQMEPKCGRESHIRPKGPLGPDELRSGEDADKMP